MIEWTNVDDRLVDAFWRYERALTTNDVGQLDRLFADAPTTLRGDAAGLLVGHDAIRDFRKSRGGAPSRTIAEVHTQVIDRDHTLIVAVTAPTAGGLGLQTQLWARDPDHGWQITAAHVSAPTPAIDSRVWRIVGAPLVPPTKDGPLTGESVAVKDLYAVAGHRTGAGNPAYLAQAQPEASNAEVLTALVEAGASIRGITQTDEFAYSLAGHNVHYGTPPNPSAPGHIPGGSSSGSAAAVALGQASIGLGTDTAGSIRVPSAYQGLFGIRTTHGVVSRRGLLPLAPRFDAVGWMTRSAPLLKAVGHVLLPPAPEVENPTILCVPELMDLAEEAVREAVIASLPKDRVTEHWDLSDLDAWLPAFRTAQAAEAWHYHKDWLQDRLDTLGPAVRERFESASQIDETTAQAAHRTLSNARRRILDLIGDRVLAMPAASTVAPVPDEADSVREATLKLTCIPSLAGLPAVTVPLRTASGLPTAVCLVAAPNTDLTLLRLATLFAAD